MDTTLQDPLVGREVDGRYLIESRIARGGMATVYLALDRRLEREVALKVMHEHLVLDVEFVHRFVREARAAARLSHPNVVQVFDQGSDGNVLYLAMEYLPGRTLRDVLAQRGALTARETVSVLEPVLGALAAAHRAGIVHRDVKPENVILTDDGRIKVADFGLARAISAPIGAAAGGTLIGTVAYLAPELVSRGIADARADVYAAGIVLFELLTGKQPFTGDDPLRVAYRHVHELVPAPTEVAPELPSAFDPVVLLATSHDPDQRPANAEAMLIQLLQARDRVPEDQFDTRAADAASLRRDTLWQQPYRPAAAPAAPAVAVAPQATRSLELPPRPGGTLLPRLRVHDEDPLQPARGSTRQRWRPGAGTLVAAIVVVLLILSGFWWFTAGPGSYLATPPLVGIRATDAERILKDAGLGYQTKALFSPTIAAGQVISTDPGGGEHVKKNGTVVLSVSKGPELVPVPTLAGKGTDEVLAALQDAGLKLGKTSRAYSDSVAKDQVISSLPVAGTRIAPGRSVDITLSKGVQPVQVPNVVGQSAAEATALLQSNHLQAVTANVDYVQGGPQPGSVAAQSPSAGLTVEVNSNVSISVVVVPAGQVVVPDVTGQKFSAARTALQQLGLQVQRQGVPFVDGRVVAQSVTGLAPIGSVVILNVGL